jgi:hypothetical protein
MAAGAEAANAVAGAGGWGNLTSPPLADARLDAKGRDYSPNQVGLAAAGDDKQPDDCYDGHCGPAQP